MIRNLKFQECEAGFSLLELTVTMAITLALMAAASTLLMQSLRTRTRENQRSQALSDAQRALNIMSREIGNSGFGLDNNGIVALDSNSTQIRIRANVHNDSASDPIVGGVPQLKADDPDEDITFTYQPAIGALVRYDRNRSTNNTTVLASNITQPFTITYLDGTGAETTNMSLVERVRIEVHVDLPPSRNEPQTFVRMMSDISLRNAPEIIKRY